MPSIFSQPCVLEDLSRFLPFLLKPFQVKGRGAWGVLTYRNGQFFSGSELLGHKITGIEVFGLEQDSRVRLEGDLLEKFRALLEWCCETAENTWSWFKELDIHQSSDHMIALTYNDGQSKQLVFKVLSQDDKELVAIFAKNANLAMQSLAEKRND